MTPSRAARPMAARQGEEAALGRPQWSRRSRVTHFSDPLWTNRDPIARLVWCPATYRAAGHSGGGLYNRHRRLIDREIVADAIAEDRRCEHGRREVVFTDRRSEGVG